MTTVPERRTDPHLCPGAAVPRGRGYAQTPVAGFHLCWFVPDALSSAAALLHPAPRQAHHVSLLHPGAALRRALRARTGRTISLTTASSDRPPGVFQLTALDQLVKYQLVTHGPMLHSSLPCGRALELHSMSLTTLPWSVMQRTLLVLRPIPQSTEHYDDTIRNQVELIRVVRRLQTGPASFLLWLTPIRNLYTTCITH